MTDRGREGSRLPSLRTVLAILPHTALQSAVSTSGRAGERLPKGESTVPRYRDSPQIQCRVTVLGWLGLFQILGALTRGIPRALDCIRPCISTFLPPLPYGRFCCPPVTIFPGRGLGSCSSSRFRLVSRRGHNILALPRPLLTCGTMGVLTPATVRPVGRHPRLLHITF